MSKLTGQREIEVSNASLQTATINIRTLQVNSKQMTLAVFRQLVRREALNKDGTLKGEVWGWVNYHPDGCAEQELHRHFIWRDGDTIVRDKVPSNQFAAEEISHWDDQGYKINRTILWALANSFINAEESGFVDEWNIGEEVYSGTITLRWRSQQWKGQIHAKNSSFIYWEELNALYKVLHTEKIDVENWWSPEAKALEFVKKLAGNHVRTELPADMVNRMLVTRNEMLTKAQQSLAQIEAAGQLFIAV